MLRRELVRPIQTYTNRTLITAILIAGGGLAAGIAMMAAPRCPSASERQIIHEISTSTSTAVPVPVIVTVEKPAPSPRASEIVMALRAGDATYVKLASLDASDPAAEVMPKHGKLRHFHDAERYRDSAVAELEDRAVPVAYRSWKDRQVVLDTGCTARVTGFAVVAQLVGSPDYAGVELAEWDAKTVLAHGSPVLAAKLDGCTTGTAATYGRDASLPAVIVPEVREDQALAAKARARLLASPAADDARGKWLEHADRKTEWHEHTPIDTLIVRHPVTGVTWVSVHAHSETDCGGPDINVWGLFRVEGDGRLAAVQLRDLGELYAVKQLIDLEGDGELELVGAPWLGFETVIARAGGDEVARHAVQFYGCPC